MYGTLFRFVAGSKKKDKIVNASKIIIIILLHVMIRISCRVFLKNSFLQNLHVIPTLASVIKFAPIQFKPEDVLFSL